MMIAHISEYTINHWTIHFKWIHLVYELYKKDKKEMIHSWFFLIQENKTFSHMRLWKKLPCFCWQYVTNTVPYKLYFHSTCKIQLILNSLKLTFIKELVWAVVSSSIGNWSISMPLLTNSLIILLLNIRKSFLDIVSALAISGIMLTY